MPRRFSGIAVIAVSLAAAICLGLTSTANADPTPKKKRYVTRHWNGYGFLPGYRPPEVIERQRAARYRQYGPYYYGSRWAGFYRGRWNGGSFGPCWTHTPIGPMWNCGK